MSALDGVVIVEGEGAVLGVNWCRPTVTNGDFATRLFPNHFGQYLLLYIIIISIFMYYIFIIYNICLICKTRYIYLYTTETTTLVDKCMFLGRWKGVDSTPCLSDFDRLLL